MPIPKNAVEIAAVCVYAYSIPSGVPDGQRNCSYRHGEGVLGARHNLYCGDASRQIIPHVADLLQREKEAGSSILFVCDNHQPDDLEFQMFLLYCIIGTAETEVIDELSEFVEPGSVVPKNRYSGFFGTDLEKRLKDLSPDKIILCGVCTDICVMHTASDARNRDYAVEVPRECVASFDSDAHAWALRHLEKILGANVRRRRLKLSAAHWPDDF